MVQILPPKTNLGTQLGEALGSGLSRGIQRGSDIGFQRGMLQNALSGIENLPKGTTPFQLASKLMQATAGIPGAERYVGQLYPILLQQLQSNAAFPGSEADLAGNISGQPSASSQPGIPSEGGFPPEKGQQGLLSTYVPEDQIDALATQYAKQTSTGNQGYQEARSRLEKRNENVEKQRDLVEKRFIQGGGKPEDWPLFAQLASNAPGKTGEEIYRNIRPLFKKYENYTKSLENFSYPGYVRSFDRDKIIDRVSGIVKNLKEMGFEDKARETLARKGLSPTEISLLVNPLSKEVREDLNKIPKAGFLEKHKDSFKTNEETDQKIKDFLYKSTDPSTSLLGIRHELWDKGYDWERIARLMNEVYESENAPKLTPEQLDDLGTLNKEPPRQSLAYIFQDLGNFWNFKRGEK